MGLTQKTDKRKDEERGSATATANGPRKLTFVRIVGWWDGGGCLGGEYKTCLHADFDGPLPLLVVAPLLASPLVAEPDSPEA